MYARIELLGHVTHYGYIAPSESLPGLFHVETFSAPAEKVIHGDGTRRYHREVVGGVMLVGPGAVYLLTPMEESDARAEFLARREWSYPPDQVADDDEMPF